MTDIAYIARETTLPKAKRPLGVSAVACLQLTKALILMTAGLLLQTNPGVVTSYNSFFYPLLYVSMRGNSSLVNAVMENGSLFAGIIFLLGAYIGSIGVGLWSMKVWARRSVILTCSMTVVLYAKSMFLPSPEVSGGTDYGAYRPDMTSVYAIIIMDALVMMYFLRSNIAERFRINTAYALGARVSQSV